MEKILPFALLEGKTVHINEKILKALRSGDLPDLYTGIVIFALLAIMFANIDGAEGFLYQGLRQICEFNAPNCDNSPF